MQSQFHRLQHGAINIPIKDDVQLLDRLFRQSAERDLFEIGTNARIAPFSKAICSGSEIEAHP
jgi:hypothetical protein